MENKITPPNIPGKEQDSKQQTETTPPHPFLKPDKHPDHKGTETRMVLALVFGVLSIASLVLCVLHGFFLLLAIVFGLASVILSVTSLQMRKADISILVVSVVSLILSIVVAGISIFSVIRFGYIFNDYGSFYDYGYDHHYDYDYGYDDFWD